VKVTGHLLRQLWNWKTATASALLRAPIFFVANLPAGLDAASAAFGTEFAYRVVAAGFYGALTTYFARRANRRRATLLALVVLPTLAHVVEYLVHRAAGTPHVLSALAASIALSMATTRFSLFVMRRGLFVPGSRGLIDDVRGLAALLRSPVAGLARRWMTAR
jgi:hypothetical protein